MDERSVVAWHHSVPGWCNHTEAKKGDGCHRTDGIWTKLVPAVAERTFDETVSLLLGVQADHVYTDTTTCRCGYKPLHEKDWRWHVAGNQAEALLSIPDGNGGRDFLGFDAKGRDDRGL